VLGGRRRTQGLRTPLSYFVSTFLLFDTYFFIHAPSKSSEILKTAGNNVSLKTVGNNVSFQTTGSNGGFKKPSGETGFQKIAEK